MTKSSMSRIGNRRLGILGKRRIGHCHEMLKSVAHEAAKEHFEVLMSASNWSFKTWKDSHPDLSGEALRAAFADEHWGKYLGFAKSTLANLLTDPTIDQKVKDEIEQALLLDNSLQRGRGANGPPSTVLNPALGSAFLEKK